MAQAMSPAPRTTLSRARRKPRWRAPSAGAWPTSPPGWPADARAPAPDPRPRPAGPRRAVHGLVPRRPPCRRGPAGVRAAAAAAGGAGLARRAQGRVLVRRAGPVLVQPRGDARLGASGRRGVRLGGDRAVAGGGAGLELGWAEGTLRPPRLSEASSRTFRASRAIIAPRGGARRRPPRPRARPRPRRQEPFHGRTADRHHRWHDRQD